MLHWQLIHYYHMYARLKLLGIAWKLKLVCRFLLKLAEEREVWWGVKVGLAVLGEGTMHDNIEASWPKFSTSTASAVEHCKLIASFKFGGTSHPCLKHSRPLTLPPSCHFCFGLLRQTVEREQATLQACRVKRPYIWCLQPLSPPPQVQGIVCATHLMSLSPWLWSDRQR